jgi:acetyltransferase-like isoleucine patch superfamily enzyme
VFASLGERAIVGANSLVSKPVPPYCFAAGSPARVIEYYGRPENRPEGLEVG